LSSRQTNGAPWLRLATLLLVLLATAGCELAGQIFEAGVWVGIVVVVIVVALIGWGLSKMRSS